MPEGKEQQIGSIFDPPVREVISSKKDGVGLKLPGPRDPAHEDPEWFQRDLDQPIDDPDAPDVDPLPTERHRTVPGL